MQHVLSFTMLVLFLMFASAQQFAHDAKSSPATLAPQPTADATPKNLLKPTDDLESWQLELTEGGKGDMEVDKDAMAIVFHVLETDGTNWHVQAYQTGLDLKEEHQYVVKFKLKAPEATEILLLGLINEEDWHEIGLHESLGPSKDFKEYEFTFEATDVVEMNNRIGFVLGDSKGTVSIKDLTLTEKSDSPQKSAR